MNRQEEHPVGALDAGRVDPGNSAFGSSWKRSLETSGTRFAGNIRGDGMTIDLLIAFLTVVAFVLTPFFIIAVAVGIAMFIEEVIGLVRRNVRGWHLPNGFR